MIIFVEGVDGTGKSTLVKRLDEMAYICFYPTRGDNDMPLVYMQAQHMKAPIIFDRGPISDLVYRLVDDTARDVLNLSQIGAVLQNAKVIFCNNNKSFERSMERGEDNITDNCTHNMIREFYVIILRLLSKFADIQVCTYDYEKDNIFKVIDFIGGNNGVR